MQKTDLVFPNWQENIVNIPASIQKYCGRPTKKATLPKLDTALAQNYRHIVLLVIDAMGVKTLENHLPADSFFRRHHVQTLTSVFPSTTASATTTLMSGLYPAEHGWFAWSVDCDGEVIELFRNRNAYTGEKTANPDFAREHFPYQFFYEGIDPKYTVHLCLPTEVNFIPDKGIFHAYRRLGQFRRQIRKICHQKDRHNLVYAYHCDLDTICHQFGPESPQARKLITKLDRTCARLEKENPDTLFVITADHGQISLAGTANICYDEPLQACLAHPVSLDPRGACFHIKPGKVNDFLSHFAKYRPDFELYATDDLLYQNIFGTKPRPELRACLGDFIAIGGHTKKMLVFSPRKALCGKKPYRGLHTGLTPEEMYVPLIIAGHQSGV